MRKLLSSNFTRLFISKIFWGEMIVSAVFGVMFILNLYRKQLASPELGYTLDQDFFIYAVFIGILTAVFCSMFIGTEYNNGTIRNKLIVGHSRVQIYLSNLIVSIVASLLICAAYIIFYCLLGIPLLGGATSPLSGMLICILISVLMVIAFAAIDTMLCMLISSKSTASVSCLITIIILIVIASYIKSRLDAPEFYEGFTFVMNDVPVSGELIPNPQYLKGNTRTIVEILYDFLPTGQGFQLLMMDLNPANLWRLPLFSMIVAGITTGIGLINFMKKDLK